MSLVWELFLQLLKLWTSFPIKLPRIKTLPLQVSPENKKPTKTKIWVNVKTSSLTLISAKKKSRARHNLGSLPNIIIIENAELHKFRPIEHQVTLFITLAVN